MIVKVYSATNSKRPYRSFILVTESNKTAVILNKMQIIKTTSKTFPAEVLASKITDLTLPFSSLTQPAP